MKNLIKILVLCLICGITTTILTACGPKLDALINHDFLQDQINDSTVETPDNTETQPEVTVCQHQHCEWHIIQNATCTTDGSKAYICLDCNTQLNTEIIPAAHHYDDGIITTPASCQPGVMTYTCIECGDTYTNPIPAVDEHHYEITIIEPNCTEDGYTLKQCSVCGDKQITDKQAAISHQESDEHPHQCKHCGKLLLTTPLEDLNDSVWYFNNGAGSGLEIHFGTNKYLGYRYKTKEGTYAKEDTEKYFGSYQILDYQNGDGTTRYEIELKDDYLKDQDNADYIYVLNYGENDNCYYLHFDGNFFNSKNYKDITLNFIGYEL